MPEEASVDPLELRTALGQKAEVMVYLAVPAWQESRANAERVRSEHNPRSSVASLERPDENTGADEEEIEFRYIQARLVLEDPDLTGYELLPLARISPVGRRRVAAAARPHLCAARSSASTPGRPLHDEVQALFRQIEAWINQEADQLVGRKVAFDSQVLGDAERVLRLSVLNAASATLQSILFTQGLHPLLMYQELCRLLGQLSIFGETRRPMKVPGYDHDNIGPIYWSVINEIRRLLGERAVRSTSGTSSRGAAEAAGRPPRRPTGRSRPREMYIGVETSELSDAECDQLMRKDGLEARQRRRGRDDLQAGAEKG